MHPSDIKSGLLISFVVLSTIAAVKAAFRSLELSVKVLMECVDVMEGNTTKESMNKVEFNVLPSKSVLKNFSFCQV